MFGITKTSKETQSFISELLSNTANTSLLASIALAKAISDTLDLPPGKVESVVDFFRTTNSVSFNSYLNTINEFIIVDYPTVNEYVLRFYTYRYYAAYPYHVTIALNNETAIEDYFGISKTFPAEALDVIKSNAIRITDYTAKFQKLLEELKASE